MSKEMEETILKSIKENCTEGPLAALASEISSLIFEEVNGGYLNHVYRVKTPDSSFSCIVKVFLPYAKVIGPSVSLETERCSRENESSVHIHSLLSECCLVPYFCDTGNSTLYIPDLPGHRLWQEELMTSCDLHLGAKLVDALVSLHSQSHVACLGQSKFSELKNQFSPLPMLTEFQHNYAFVQPFRANHRDNKACHDNVREKLDEIISDPAVTKAIQLAREWLVPENATCLIHGDMHTSSVMVNLDKQDVKLIDTECTRVGPEAFDIARLVCGYVLLYHYHQEKSGGGVTRCDHTQLTADMVDLICITLSRYMEGMSKALLDKFDKHLIWKQILLFLGIEIIAWISGPMSLGCLECFPEAQMLCLNTALRLLHRQTLSLDPKGVSQLIHDSR